MRPVHLQRSKQKPRARSTVPAHVSSCTANAATLSECINVLVITTDHMGDAISPRAISASTGMGLMQAQTSDLVVRYLAASALLIYGPTAWSQCASGIPGAGNPGCVPPSAAGSPYGQPSDVGPITPAPAPAVWEDRWGAIAIDGQSGAAGGANKSSTKQDATQLALERCATAGGVHCEIAIAFVNQCTAIAQRTGGGIVSTATAADTDQASARALNRCGNSDSCKVISTLCAVPVRVK